MGSRSAARGRSRLLLLAAPMAAALVLLATGLLPSGGRTATSQVAIQLCFMIDSSGSVSGSDFVLERDAIAAAIGDASIVPQDGTIEISVGQFGSSAVIEVAPTVIDSAATAASVSSQVAAISKGGGSTFMSGAVNTCSSAITGSPEFATAPTQVINVATDGYPNSQSATLTARDNAVAAGIDQLHSEAVGAGAGTAFLLDLAWPQPGELVASGGTPSGTTGFVMEVTTFADFEAAIRVKVQTIIFGRVGLDHFRCYQGRTAVSTTPFQRLSVTLEDQFESKNTEVVAPMLFCNPVDKDGGGIGDPTAHLTCYAIRDELGQTRFTRRDVLIDNQFGEHTLTVLASSLLCVPSEKDGVQSALNLDHFKCYVSRVKPGTTFSWQYPVTLTDQFQTKETSVLLPLFVCNPVDKDAGGILDASSHLVCYLIKDRIAQRGSPADSFFPGRDVEVMNQFGQQTITAFEPSLLCVPSDKTVQ